MVNSCGITTEEEKRFYVCRTLFDDRYLVCFVGLTCETKVKSAKHMLL